MPSLFILFGTEILIYFPKLKSTVKDQRFAVIETVQRNVKLTLKISLRGTSQMFHTMIEISFDSVTPKATTLMKVDLVYQHKRVILKIIHISHISKL